MAVSQIPLSEQIVLATAVKTAAATGKLRLIKSTISLAPTINQAALVAIEADFTGYAAITFTTLPSPYPDPAGGATIPVPTQEFTVGSGGTVIGNDIYGGWIEDSAGNLLVAFVTNPFNMNASGNVLVITIFVNLFGPGGVTVLYGTVPQ